DELRGAALVDLVAQVGDVNGDAVGGAFEVVVPDALRDLRLRQHLVRVPHQKFQQGELSGGQLDRGVATPNLVRLQVKDKVGHLQPVGMTILLFASHQ